MGRKCMRAAVGEVAVHVEATHNQLFRHGALAVQKSSVEAVLGRRDIPHRNDKRAGAIVQVY